MRPLFTTIAAVIVALTSAATAAPVAAHIGDWLVEHKSDHFEDHYDISTAALSDDKKRSIMISCSDTKGFEIAFSSPHTIDNPLAYVIVRVDDGPTVRLHVDDPSYLHGSFITAHHAEQLEEPILKGRVIGLRVKLLRGDKDVYYKLRNVAPGAALIRKTCPAQS